MLKIAIVGCGKIADQHVHAIARVPDCQIVALCDRELLMARQLGERFGIAKCFSDVKEMLRVATPNVVHITTPPQSHFAIAKQCLAAGSHVYLEKPFTVTAEEAQTLIQYAQRFHLNLTAGHNYQFTLEMLEMRRLVDKGFLGGKPMHAESHWSYDLSDGSYVGPLIGNRGHWVRQLPGQLFQNIISHGISKLAEFLDENLIEIIARAHQSPLLRDMEGEEILDELRVLIRDRNGTTASFFFSTQVRPGLNELRLCGPANSLIVDHISGSVIRKENRSCKSYLTYFVPPLRAAREHLRNAKRNLVNFLRQELHQDCGMRELIERFYQSVRTSGPPPISYREIMLTARIMDEIFTQIYPGKEARRVETKTTPI